MEINYDLILKYLGTPKPQYSFETKKNLMTFSTNFPKEFNELLGDKFYRLGITQKIDNKNVSFYTSLLSLLCDEYISLMESEENGYITNLHNKMNEYINAHPDLNKKLGLKKPLFCYNVNVWLLELLVNMFSINMLILDFKTLEIFTVFQTDIMNPWKPFLLFGKYENNWEPIKNNDKKLFSYNDSIIKKILTNIQIKYFESDVIKKDYILLDNIQEIIHNEFKEEVIENKDDKITDETDEIDEANDNNTFVKVDINKAKLTKMTKDEIIKYINKQNIKGVINKKTTKKDLIELIINYSS